jgi:heat shock protein HtpX
MIAALRRLDSIAHGVENLPKNLAAAGIAGGGMASLFASHPSTEERIAALQQG